jgi:hypothetical protein
MGSKMLVIISAFFFVCGLDSPSTYSSAQMPENPLIHPIQPPTIADSLNYFTSYNDSLEGKIRADIADFNRRLTAYEQAHKVQTFPYRTREMGNVLLVYEKGKAPYTVPRKKKK